MTDEEKSFLTLFEEFKQKATPLLEKISQLRKSTIFPLLFHIQASINPWCVSRVYDVLRRLDENELKNVDVILFSLGGDMDSAYHIGRMLHRHVKEKLSFIVPRVAASAATLLTFSGNRILMSSASQLGPIDPQVEVARERYVSARSLCDAVKVVLQGLFNSSDVSKSSVEAFLERFPLLEATDFDRLLKHAKKLAINLLKLRMVKNDTKAEKIAGVFVNGFDYHGRSITIDECIELGLEVEEMKDEVLLVVWEFSKLWEELAIIKAKAKSEIQALELGKGIAFIPIEIETEELGTEETLTEALIGKKTG